MKEKRNYSVDIIKLISAYIIIFLHFPPNGIIGLIIVTLSRFAVPFFFILSGYYSYQQEEASIRHIWKLVSLFVLADILYFFVNVFQQGLVPYFHQTYTKKTLWDFLLLQKPFTSTHLWFLLALILCYFFLVVFKKLILSYSKAFYIGSIFLLFINLFLGEFLSIFDCYTYSSYIRSFLLMGLPFFIIGRFINENKWALMSRFSISTIQIIVFFCLILTLAERIFAGRVELYLGSVFMSFFLMLGCIKHPCFTISTSLHSLLKCSTKIYIFHPFVIALLHFDHDKTYSMVVSIMIPVIVCIVTTIWSLLFNYFMTFFNQYKKLIDFKYGNTMKKKIYIVLSVFMTIFVSFISWNVLNDKLCVGGGV